MSILPAICRRHPALQICILLPALTAAFAATQGAEPGAPYPPSALVQSIDWQWESHVTAAPGSDLWPITWGPDDHLYTAWGDGGGFGGSDTDSRVALGFGRIEGDPEHFRGVNVNGGKNPEHPADYPNKGKTSVLICVDGILYSIVNLQDGAWPTVNHQLIWSKDFGATWTKADWLFPKGAKDFLPEKFLNFGKDGGGTPENLAGYVYLYGATKNPNLAEVKDVYLARIPKDRLREREAYEFFVHADEHGAPSWSKDFAAATPVFTDARGVKCSGAAYDPGVQRFLLTSYHTGPGQLGLFDAPNPWGPWTTIDYEEHWGKMSAAGEGLSCDFPQKWMSADGLTLWSVFSCYGETAHDGINAHDRFNLVRAVLKLK